MMMMMRRRDLEVGGGKGGGGIGRSKEGERGVEDDGGDANEE